MLQTYRVETTIAEKGILTVQGLPFHKGDTPYPTDAIKEGVEIWHR